jgi:hypothetical protein
MIAADNLGMACLTDLTIILILDFITHRMVLADA